MTQVQTDIPGFVKDLQTGLVQNTDDGKLQEYQNKRAAIKKQKDFEEQLNQLAGRVAALEAQNLILHQQLLAALNRPIHVTHSEPSIYPQQQPFYGTQPAHWPTVICENPYPTTMLGGVS